MIPVPQAFRMSDKEGAISAEVETLMENHETFHARVYTPIAEALTQLQERQSSCTYTPAFIPDVFKAEPKALYSVALATPNYALQRYLTIADALDLEPLIFERRKDKYVPQGNPTKRALGKMPFMKGTNKQGAMLIHKRNVIDFNVFAGKAIEEIRTLWGESLIEFHHRLLFTNSSGLLSDKNIFDNSGWFYETGGTTRAYYKALLSLVVRHGILFENFLLDDEERDFTRFVSLPAFLEVERETGYKPLVVALEPTELEGKEFWVSYSSQLEKELLTLLDGARQ